MGRQLAEHPCTFASTFESCSFHVKQSKQSARRRIVKTKVAKKRSVQQSGRLFWRNGFVCGCRRQKAELRFSHAGYSYLLMAKGSKHSLRLLFFAAFWSAKSGAKTDPPTKKAKRRGLTLAPGDYSRVCKQTVPSARAFSPHLFERLFCQAGVVRRGTRREGCVRDKQKAQKPTIAPGSGFKPPHYRSERKKRAFSGPRARSGRL